MSMPIPIDLICPCCGESFEDEYGCLLACSGGGFYSDFRSGYGRAHSHSELLLYSCDHCGYTDRAVLERFDTPVSVEVKEFVLREIKRQQKDSPPSKDATPGSYSKFERYAILQEFLGASAFQLGEYYLRASWTTNSERFRSIALARFKEVLKQSGPIPEVEAPLSAYLAGEIARQLGEEEESRNLFTLANKLIRTRNHPELQPLELMLRDQSAEPSEDPRWDFPAFILDPLSFYHCQLLYSAGVEKAHTNQNAAFQILSYVYSLCEAAVQRYTSAMKDSAPMGFWMDAHLIGIGIKSLQKICELDSVTGSDLELERLRHIYYQRVMPHLKLLEGKQSSAKQQKKQFQDDSKEIGSVSTQTKIVAYIASWIIGGVLIVASALSASLVGYLIHQPISPWMIAGALTGSIVAIYLCVAIISTLHKLLPENSTPNSGSKAFVHWTILVALVAVSIFLLKTIGWIGMLSLVFLFAYKSIFETVIYRLTRDNSEKLGQS